MEFEEYLDSPLFWLRRAGLGARNLMNEALGEHKLTGAQHEVLRQLWLEDGMDQRELQKRLYIQSATLTRIVDGLVERDLAERRQNPNDARVKQLFLTDKGRRLPDTMGKVTARIQGRVLDGFSASEAALLKEWLRRMAMNMGDHDENYAD